MITRATRILSLLAAAASLGVMIYAGDFSSLELILIATWFSVWICTPYATAWVAAGKLQGDSVAPIILLTGLILITGFGLYAYLLTFFLTSKPDAQAGLVFVVIPLYQLGAILLVWALASLVKRLRQR